jgi:ERCC4-related helicase
LAKNGDVCYKAKARYTNPIHNGYGWEFKGINELYANELRERLATTTSRTTKLQVAHLLPPFDVKQLYIEHPKQPQIKEWAQDALEQNSHIAILTHLRATAEQIVQALQAEQPYLITGALGPEKRNMLLAEAKAKPSAIIVATMHSIGIGIDLTFCQTALFAELYYRPETIIQALGRFSRLSGKVPTSCVIMIEKNTNDEIIGMKLGEKIQAINMAIEAGLTDTKLEAVLNSTEGWEDELFKACKFEEESDDY